MALDILSRLGAFGLMAFLGFVIVTLALWGIWLPTNTPIPFVVRLISIFCGVVFSVVGVFFFIQWGVGIPEEAYRIRRKWTKTVFVLAMAFLFVGIIYIVNETYPATIHLLKSSIRANINAHPFIAISLVVVLIALLFVPRIVPCIKKSLDNRKRKAEMTESVHVSLDSNFANVQFSLIVIPPNRMRFMSSEMPMGPALAGVRVDGINASYCRALHIYTQSIEHTDSRGHIWPLDMNIINPTNDVLARTVTNNPCIVVLMEAEGRIANFVFANNNKSEDMAVGSYKIEMEAFHINQGQREKIGQIEGILKVTEEKGFVDRICKKFRWINTANG